MEYLLENGDVVLAILSAVVGLLCFVVTFVRTGSIRKSIDNFKEVYVKYDTVDSKVKKPTSQSFSDYKDDYILNPATNELEKTEIPKNIQAYIDSFVECALDRALQRFLPDNVVEDKVSYADYTQKIDDLSIIGQSMELAESYRDKYNLPDNYSFAQIYEFVDKQASEIKSKIASYNKIEEVKNVESKETEVK